MKRWSTGWRSLLIAFSMYSRIPVHTDWEWTEEENRRVLCFFPLVGFVIGGVELLWFWLCRLWGAAVPAAAAFGAVLPLLLTGGIHADGFLDTSDALHSWQGRERRLEILKDPHLGAFAVIRFAILGGLWFAALSQLYASFSGAASARGTVLKPAAAAAAAGTGAAGAGQAVVSVPELTWICIFGLSFVLSRILSALAVMYLPNARGEGLLYTFSDPKHEVLASNRRILWIELALTSASILLLQPLAGGISLAAAALLMYAYKQSSERNFGGITGDLAGWFVCRCEVGTALALAAVRLLL